MRCAEAFEGESDPLAVSLLCDSGSHCGSCRSRPRYRKRNVAVAVEMAPQVPKCLEQSPVPECPLDSSTKAKVASDFTSLRCDDISCATSCNIM